MACCDAGVPARTVVGWYEWREAPVSSGEARMQQGRGGQGEWLGTGCCWLEPAAAQHGLPCQGTTGPVQHVADSMSSR